MYRMKVEHEETKRAAAGGSGGGGGGGDSTDRLPTPAPRAYATISKHLTPREPPLCVRPHGFL